MPNEHPEDAPEVSHEEICIFISQKTGLEYNQIDIILKHSEEQTLLTGSVI